ncbi:MAG TPA: hypothetical protein VG406_18435 [Isosphaeraceae bacterium]|nr:hypothetical protein [Isosphaeraceae bacterium]
MGYSFPDPDQTRRPEVPGFPIPLADGRPWHFARPRALLFPIFAAGGCSVGRAAGYVEPIRSLLDDFAATLVEAPPPGAISFDYGAFFLLAKGLLQAAHDLDDAAAGKLLAVPMAAVSALTTEVVAVAAGRRGVEGFVAEGLATEGAE